MLRKALIALQVIVVLYFQHNWIFLGLYGNPRSLTCQAILGYSYEQVDAI